MGVRKIERIWGFDGKGPGDLKFLGEKTLGVRELGECFFLRVVDNDGWGEFGFECTGMSVVWRRMGFCASSLSLANSEIFHLPGLTNLIQTTLPKRNTPAPCGAMI